MENKKFITDGCPDDKYFTFKGEISVNCPICGAELKKDFEDDHIEYINDYVGKEDNEFRFWCDNCEKEFMMPVIIKSVSYTVELEFDKSKLSEYSD